MKQNFKNVPQSTRKNATYKIFIIGNKYYKFDMDNQEIRHRLENTKRNRKQRKKIKRI